MVKMTSRVKRPESLLPNRQRTLVQRLGLRVPALVEVEPRQVVEALGDIWMLGAEGLFPDRQMEAVHSIISGRKPDHSISPFLGDKMDIDWCLIL